MSVLFLCVKYYRDKIKYNKKKKKLEQGLRTHTHTQRKINRKKHETKNRLKWKKEKKTGGKIYEGGERAAYVCVFSYLKLALFSTCIFSRVCLAEELFVCVCVCVSCYHYLLLLLPLRDVVYMSNHIHSRLLWHMLCDVFRKDANGKT